MKRPRPTANAAIFAGLAWLAAGAGCAHLPPGRYAIDDVTIEGANEVSDSDIEDKIATAESPKFLWLFRGVVFDYELFDRYVLERDLARVERVYRARGYYEAHARAGRIEKTSDEHVRVTVVVEEGHAVKVGEVRLDGVAALPFDDAAAVLLSVRRKLRAARPFDEDRYLAAQENALRALGDRGYAFAQVKGSVEVDLSRHVADVTLSIQPGEKARLGKVTIDGLQNLPEGPVRRALDLAEGEIFSTSRLEAARRAILALGVFSEADITPVLTNPGSRVVPIKVEVAPSQLRAVKLGGGLELDVIRTDWHLLAGWEDRNFLGGLRRLAIDVKPGVVLYPTRLGDLRKPERLLVETRARAELRQPGFIEARTTGIVRGDFDLYPVIFPGGASLSYIPGYRDLGAGLGLDRTFGPLYASVFYNFQTSFPFSYTGDLPAAFSKKVVLSYVDFKTTLDFRDDPIRPHAGVFLGNSLQFAGIPVTPNFRDGSDLFAKDIRVQPEVRAYVPLARRWTLALRATTGFVLPTNYGGSFRPDAEAVDPNDIQLAFFRGFFSGGPSSNRGYPYRGVGPKEQLPFFLGNFAQLPDACRVSPDSDACREELPRFCADNPDLLACKFPTGGLSLWEASVEVRFPIAGDLGGALFCDASDVSRYRFDLRFLYPHLSCGAGLHYLTPVGPIRLDAGFQIPGMQVLAKNPDPTEKPSDSFFAVAIGIGEAF